MPLFFAALFGSLASFFAQWLTKKAALGAAALTVMAGLTVGFWVALKGLMTAVLVAAPSLCALDWLLPNNTGACFAAVISAHIVRAVYDWHIQNIKVLSYIT